MENGHLLNISTFYDVTYYSNYIHCLCHRNEISADDMQLKSVIVLPVKWSLL